MSRGRTTGGHFRRPPPWRMAGLCMAFALPVLAPLLLAVARVQSVTLSPTDVTSGAASTATVTLEAPSLADVAVDLFSSNPGLASVPPKGIVIPAGSRTGSFAVTTGSGTLGCATISATVRNTAAPRSATLFIKQSLLSSVSSPLRIGLSANPVVGGESLTGTIEAPAAGLPVQLASSNPTVTVPAGVTLVAPTVTAPGGGQFSPQGVGVASFTITTTRVKAPTCAIITASGAGPSKRVLLKVFNPAF